VVRDTPGQLALAEISSTQGKGGEIEAASSPVGHGQGRQAVVSDEPGDLVVELLCRVGRVGKDGAGHQVQVARDVQPGGGESIIEPVAVPINIEIPQCYKVITPSGL
jgi:hypothetical protein